MRARASLIAWMAALAVVLASGTYFAFVSEGPRGESAVLDDPAARAASESAREPAQSSAHVDRAGGERGAVAPDDHAGAAGGSKELTEVEIVAADTRAAVPGAIVWCWPRSSALESERDFEAWLRSSALEEHQSEALKLRSDANGLVRVPSTPLGFHLAAAAGELWGAASFGAERPARPSVALAADLTLRVRVVDASGAPVLGVPVALRQRRTTRSFDASTARTAAPDGIAELRHAGHFLPGGADSAREFVLAVRGLFDPPLETAVVLGSPAPPTLVLPQSGACEIVVVDAGGREVRGPMDASLRFDDALSSGGAASLGENLVSTRGDPLVFEHVALGRELAVFVSRAASSTVLTARGAGPRTAGERVTLRVPLGASVAILSGRLVDATGKPMPGIAARAQLEASDPRARFEASWRIETRVDGTFSLDIAPIDGARAGTLLALHQLSDDGVELAAARKPLPRELAAGAYDLGDFVLLETPIAVAGSVADAAGKPIAGAAVVATAALDPAQESSERSPGEPRLQPVRSDAAGKFEIRCEPWAGKLSVAAQKDGLVGDPQLAVFGARDVRLVLAAGGSIEGRVLLDPSLLDTLVLVEASLDRSSPSEAPVPTGTPAVLAANGAFRIDGLRAGSHSLRVIYAATAAELARVEELDVRSGATTRDLRVNPLDLRESFRVIELEPQDEHGERVADARAFSRPSADAEAKWTAALRKEGRLLLLADGRPLDVAISAAGYLRCELERVGESRKVALRRAARLRLQLAGGQRAPEPPLYLGVELIPLDGGRFPGFADAPIRSFDERGELVCEAPFTGPVRVELSLALRQGGAQSMEALREERPRIVTVADHAGEQVFEISLDPERLKAAARTLRGEN